MSSVVRNRRVVFASMHGVRIRYVLEAASDDPLGGFWDVFPEAEGAADVSVVVRRDERVLSPPALDGYEPFFFHGRVQAYRGRAGLLLWNGVGRAEVSADATSIRVDVPIVAHEHTEAVLHVALLWALRERRFFDLHAAAVVPARGGPIVIAGDSGMGKTTLTLSFLEAGFKYLGDDRVLIRPGRGAPAVFSYPRAFHLGANTMRAFPRLAGRAQVLEAGEKQRVDPTHVFPLAHDPGGSAPSMLLFPRLQPDASSSVARLSNAEAFGHLLVSSAIVAVDGMSYRDEHLACLRDLVSAIPAHEIIVGRDLLDDPVGVVNGLLSACAGA